MKTPRTCVSGPETERIPSAPAMTSGIGATTFGSSAARALACGGPVALRPSLTAGLPLSCHLQSGEGYMRSCIRANGACQVFGGPLSFFANRPRRNVLGARAVVTVTRARCARAVAKKMRASSASRREFARCEPRLRDRARRARFELRRDAQSVRIGLLRTNSFRVRRRELEPATCCRCPCPRRSASVRRSHARA